MKGVNRMSNLMVQGGKLDASRPLPRSTRGNLMSPRCVVPPAGIEKTRPHRSRSIAQAARDFGLVVFLESVEFVVPIRHVKAANAKKEPRLGATVQRRSGPAKDGGKPL
jgi:hypothetical protein